MILIFTNKEDSHPTHVIQYLKAWGVPVFRLNTECLLTDYRFSWWANADDCDFHIRNIKNGLDIYGHEISAIWDRRPQVPKELPRPNEYEDVNKLNLDEAHEFLSFIRYYLKDVFSIGSIVEDRPAASKMLQLSIARQLGMRIPDTCFANEMPPIASLAKRYPALSLKPIGESCVLLNEEDEYVFYSQKVDSNILLQQPQEAFSQTVSFVQNYVNKAYELRITVCCGDLVACKIDSQVQDDDKGKIDWRQGYEFDLKHEIVDIPDAIKTFCYDFLVKMKLNFGCFDFIVTPEGEYVFLECNPNGQWLWIELYTGYDISEIIARNLSRYEPDVRNHLNS
jgi:glutathione synthase/RimK-type ligase-like ATP-grasp enzyme